MPAAYRTLPMAWYPRKRNRVALLRVAGTPAYALGQRQYQWLLEEGQGLLTDAQRRLVMLPFAARAIEAIWHATLSLALH